MMSLGYDEVAKICLTHSFNNQTTKEYIGKFDVSDEELNLIKNTLAKVDMSDYDRLIQLCDSLAGSEGVLDIEERMGDVKQRYGYYPQEKWDSNIRLKKYFEEKAGKDIYEIHPTTNSIITGHCFLNALCFSLLRFQSYQLYLQALSYLFSHNTFPLSVRYCVREGHPPVLG